MLVNAHILDSTQRPVKKESEVGVCLVWHPRLFCCWKRDRPANCPLSGGRSARATTASGRTIFPMLVPPEIKGQKYISTSPVFARMAPLSTLLSGLAKKMTSFTS